MNRFSQKHKEFLVEQYVNKKKSTYEIAQELNTYPNKVRRALKALGIDTKDGVVRVSMVHYNSLDDVDKLINAFEKSNII